MAKRKRATARGKDFSDETTGNKLGHIAPMFKRGDFIEHKGLLAVVVGTDQDGGAPEYHLALWYGDPQGEIVNDNRFVGLHPMVWIVPAEYCRPAATLEIFH